MTCHLEELCQIYVFVINSFFLSPTQKIDAQAIEEFYGLTSDISKNSESGYILFYQSREWQDPGMNKEQRMESRGQNNWKKCSSITNTMQSTPQPTFTHSHSGANSESCANSTLTSFLPILHFPECPLHHHCILEGGGLCGGVGGMHPNWPSVSHLHIEGTLWTKSINVHNDILQKQQKNNILNDTTLVKILKGRNRTDLTI